MCSSPKISVFAAHLFLCRLCCILLPLVYTTVTTGTCCAQVQFNCHILYSFYCFLSLWFLISAIIFSILTCRYFHNFQYRILLVRLKKLCFSHRCSFPSGPLQQLGKQVAALRPSCACAESWRWWLPGAECSVYRCFHLSHTMLW